MEKVDAGGEKKVGEHSRKFQWPFSSLLLFVLSAGTG